MNGYEHETADGEEPIDFRVHEGIVLALYLTPTMYQNMSSVFDTILNLLKRLIKTMPKTGLGFYIGNCNNEEDSKHSTDTPDGVYRIFKLSDIHDKMLKILDTYLKNSIPKHSVINISFSTGERWNDLFPLKESNSDEYFGTSLYSLLQQTQIDFNRVYTKSEEYTSRKLFLFTDCLTPWNKDEAVLKKLQNKLRDLNSSGISVYPFILQKNIKTEDTDEDRLGEFRELFDFTLDSESSKYLPAINEISMDALEEKIMKHSTVKRFAFQCPLIFNNFKMAVKGLNLSTPAEWKKIKFTYKDGKYHHASRKATPMATTRALNADEITKVYQIADQFMPEDNQIKTECVRFGEEEKPILHIIGTRNYKAFNPAYIISKPLFMIADEDEDDSLNKFASLYQSLLRKKMMALCWGMPRKVSYPRMYYLIPTGLVEEENLTFRYPQALAMIEIPYGDEIRKAPPHVKALERLEEVDDLELLDELIAGTCEDRFENFPNPVMAWNFQVMEDHILQVDDTEALSMKERQLQMDQMRERMLVMKKKLETDSELFGLVNQLKNKYNRISNANELKRIAELNESAAKRMKMIGSAITDAQAVQYYNESGMKKCTNDVLKLYIKSKNGSVKAGRNKAEMIANIVEYLQSNSYL